MSSSINIKALQNQSLSGGSCCAIAGPRGPMGPQGVGILSISDNGDNTMTITLTNGKTTTFTLGHNGKADIQDRAADIPIANGVGIRSITDNGDGTVTIALTDGRETSYKTGRDGARGKDGVGIKDIRNNNDGTITIMLTDDSETTFNTGADGPKGNPGEDHVSIKTVTDNNNGTVTITLTDDREMTYSTGKDGLPGQPGKDGVGIESVKDNADGTITITLTDRSSTTYKIGAIAGENVDNGAPVQGGVGIKSVDNNGDGTVTINLTDGRTTTYTTGKDGSNGLPGRDGVGILNVVDNDNGTVTIKLTNNVTTTYATGKDGVGIGSVDNNGNGTVTIKLTDGRTTTYTTGKDGSNGLPGRDGVGILGIENRDDGKVTIKLTDGRDTTYTVGKDGKDGKDGVCDCAQKDKEITGWQYGPSLNTARLGHATMMIELDVPEGWETLARDVPEEKHSVILAIGGWNLAHSSNAEYIRSIELLDPTSKTPEWVFVDGPDGFPLPSKEQGWDLASPMESGVLAFVDSIVDVQGRSQVINFYVLGARPKEDQEGKRYLEPIYLNYELRRRPRTGAGILRDGEGFDFDLRISPKIGETIVHTLPFAGGRFTGWNIYGNNVANHEGALLKGAVELFPEGVFAMMQEGFHSNTAVRLIKDEFGRLRARIENSDAGRYPIPPTKTVLTGLPIFTGSPTRSGVGCLNGYPSRNKALNREEQTLVFWDRSSFGSKVDYHQELADFVVGVGPMLPDPPLSGFGGILIENRGNSYLSGGFEIPLKPFGAQVAVPMVGKTRQAIKWSDSSKRFKGITPSIAEEWTENQTKGRRVVEWMEVANDLNMPEGRYFTGSQATPIAFGVNPVYGRGYKAYFIVGGTEPVRSGDRGGFSFIEGRTNKLTPIPASANTSYIMVEDFNDIVDSSKELLLAQESVSRSKATADRVAKLVEDRQ